MINDAYFGPEDLDNAIDAYDRLGFVVLRGAVPSEDLDLIQAELAAAQEKLIQGTLDSRYGTELLDEPGATFEGEAFRPATSREATASLPPYGFAAARPGRALGEAPASRVAAGKRTIASPSNPQGVPQTLLGVRRGKGLTNELLVLLWGRDMVAF